MIGKNRRRQRAALYFMAEITGRHTAMEHLPNPEKSLITAIFFCRLCTVRFFFPSFIFSLSSSSLPLPYTDRSFAVISRDNRFLCFPDSFSSASPLFRIRIRKANLSCSYLRLKLTLLKYPVYKKNTWSDKTYRGFSPFLLRQPGKERKTEHGKRGICRAES